MMEPMKTEAEYQAEWDARTLADAERIKADKARLKKAEDAATKIVNEQNKEAQAMRKVAGKRGALPDPNQVNNQMDKPKRAGNKSAIATGKLNMNPGSGVTTIIP